MFPVLYSPNEPEHFLGFFTSWIRIRICPCGSRRHIFMRIRIRNTAYPWSYTFRYNLFSGFTSIWGPVWTFFLIKTKFFLLQVKREMNWPKKGYFRISRTFVGFFITWLYWRNAIKFATKLVLSYLICEHHFLKIWKLMIGKKVMTIFISATIFIAVTVPIA